MPTMLREPDLTTEGNESAASFQRTSSVETVGKRDAIRCLLAAIESFTAAREMSREQLAEDLCGMTPGNFSKVINGVQGDFLGLLHDKLTADIRHDYYERIAELERVDPLVLALEQVQGAIMRALRLMATRQPARMAKAHVPTQKQKRTA